MVLTSPPGGEECYGKCQDCLSSHFHRFAAVHTPFLLHDAQPSGHDTGARGPHGDPPTSGVSPDGGANASFLNSSFLLHNVQPPGHDDGSGSPPGGVPTQYVSPDGGAGPSASNSFFLSFAPLLFCRICGVAFQPQIGVECDSVCDACLALPPPPKRVKHLSSAHRKAGPPS